MRCLADKQIAEKYAADKAVIIVANTEIRRQIVYAGVQLGMIGIGINAMTVSSNPFAPGNTAIIAAVIIIAIELFLILNAILDHVDRNRLLAQIGGRRATDSRNN